MHGGDIYRNSVQYDFSVNVNPLGMPESVRRALLEAADHAGEYPDPVHQELRNALAQRYDLPANRVVPGSGASELITAVIHAFHPKSCLLTAPCYSGYRNAMEAIYPACHIIEYPLREEQDFVICTREGAEQNGRSGEKGSDQTAGSRSRADDHRDPEEPEASEDSNHLLRSENGATSEMVIDETIRQLRPELLILTNPSNPNGRLIAPNDMRAILSACSDAGTAAVVDECFLPLTGEEETHSLLNPASHRMSSPVNWIVLRAFTKTFAIPGVRLGYAICSDEALAERIRRPLPEWNLSVFAERAGLACLREEGGIRKSAEYVARERERLAQGLTGLGFRVFPSDANYLLFRAGDTELYKKMLGRGILIRDCADYAGLGTGYYRIAVRTEAENQVLLDTIRKIETQ